MNITLLQPAFIASKTEYSIISSPQGPTGESCFIPAGYGKVEISGNGEIIATDLV